jgi:hypothetical protein
MSILNNTEDRTPGELIITLVTIQQNNVDWTGGRFYWMRLTSSREEIYCCAITKVRRLTILSRIFLRISIGLVDRLRRALFGLRAPVGFLQAGKNGRKKWREKKVSRYFLSSGILEPILRLFHLQLQR